MMEIMGGWWDPCSICPSRIFNHPRHQGYTSVLGISGEHFAEILKWTVSTGAMFKFAKCQLTRGFSQFSNQFSQFFIEDFWTSRSFQVRTTTGRRTPLSLHLGKMKKPPASYPQNREHDDRLSRLVNALLVNWWKNAKSMAKSIGLRLEGKHATKKKSCCQRRRGRTRPDMTISGVFFPSKWDDDHPWLSDQYFSEVITCYNML